MNSLEQFLALPDVTSIYEEVEVSKRLNNLFGKFKVKAMTEAEYKDYQHKANYKLDKKGGTMDTVKFFVSMVAGQTIYPNFCDPELLAACNCTSGEELISKKLLIGEIITLAGRIQSISGFGDDINEEVDQAKN